MSVTVDLSPDEVAQIERLTQLQNENESVAKAAREFLRVEHATGKGEGRIALSALLIVLLRDETLLAKGTAILTAHATTIAPRRQARKPPAKARRLNLSWRCLPA